MPGFKKSRYTVGVPINANGEYAEALYHTMTGGFILLPGSAWSDLPADVGGVLDSEALGVFMRQGMVVPANTDEAALYHAWRQQYVHDYSSLRSTVLLTRQCNLRCRYCIVEAENRTMSSGTAVAMDDFYTGHISKKRPEQVRDSFIGGEPFLNPGVLLESAARRYEFCRGRGIDYGFTITTNGVLLTPEKVKPLMAAGLTSIRVSLAGPGPVHDNLRVTAHNGPTYETIMGNLRAISGMTGIIVECQYDAGVDDYLGIPDMMDDMANRGIDVTEIAFTPIFARRHDNRFHTGMGDPGKMQFLVKEAARRGFPMMAVPPSNSCMTDLRSRFVFDTDGSIIPCPSVQSGEMAYGHVERGVDFVAEAAMLPRNLPEKCLTDCELLPVCNGGCRMNALIGSGDFSGVACHYDSLRRSLEDYIREMAAEAMGKAGDVVQQNAA